jgi:hypothetical protein
MTHSRWFAFCAGMAAGAVGHAAFPKLKETLGPLAAAAMAGAGSAFNDACAAAAAEKSGETNEPAQKTVAGTHSAHPKSATAASHV